jgi:DNA-binding GntR family transcriptional regulator
MNDFDGRTITSLPIPGPMRPASDRWPGGIETDRRFLVPDNIASELVRFLEEQIIYGTLQPGARLVEEEIVSRYRVSRSPVREAFRVLEHEGLAVRLPRRGIRVSEINIQDLNDLYAPRLLLEGQAAENAARHRTGSQMDVIRNAAEAMQAQAGDGHTQEFFTRSLAFSTAVHAACGSRTLRRLLDHVGKQALRYRFLAYTYVPELMEGTVTSAASITEAIARRDAPGARAVTLMWLEQSRDRLREAMAVQA